MVLSPGVGLSVFPAHPRRDLAMPNFINLPPFTEDGDVHVVVEIPPRKQSQICERRETRDLHSVESLLTGLTYPHDWGIVPSTKADDGDPST